MASPALDTNGSAVASVATSGGSSATSGSISTSQSPDLIILVVMLGKNPGSTLGHVSSISSNTGGSLTWSQRGVSNQESAINYNTTLEVWTAPAASTLSGFSVIANLVNSPTSAGLILFAVNGLFSTSAPWDVNAGLPKVAVAGNAAMPTITFSTSQADDLLLYISAAANSSGSSIPSGYTSIASIYSNRGATFANVAAGYKSVSAKQTNATATGASGGTGIWVTLVDALTADAPPAPNPFVRYPARFRRKRPLPRRPRVFFPRSTNLASATAAGQATVSGAGRAVATSVGSAAGQATVSGHTVGINESVGTASGHATVSGVSQAEDQAAGSAPGHATVEGVAVAVAESVGAISGHATVSGVGLSGDETVGSISGHATVSGVGIAVKASVGLAPGMASVHGVGATNQGVASAAGHATVRGVSGGGSETQISAVARETLISVPPVGEIAAIVRETLADPTAVAEMSAVARETLLTFAAEAEVSAIIRETLYASLPSLSVGTAHGQATVSGVVSQNQAIATAAGQATVQGISISVIPPEPPQGPTLTQNIIPSYLYVQYNDDNDLQAMVAAYNAYTQAYLDYLNNLNLPIYTTDPVSGLLLDWVGTNLYGYPRPALPQYGRGPIGPLNTWTPNEIVLNGWIPGEGTSYNATTDDIYRRCLTWHFYKGDGKQMSIRWLKRRIERFLNGINGTDTDVAATYDVSVTFPSPQHCTITLPTSSTSKIFQAAIQGGLLETPFQIEFTVDLT